MTQTNCNIMREACVKAHQNLIDYVEHDRNCIRSQFAGGRTTEDSGYEQNFAGKWYRAKPIDNTPKCDCGLDEAIAESFRLLTSLTTNL